MEEQAIEGYTIVTPLKMDQRNLTRMLVLVRDGIQVEVRQDIMENDTTSVWMEFERKGKRKLMIGAVYREHTVTGIPKPNNTGDVSQQIKRWSKFLKQWSKIGSKYDTYIVGDTNLDHRRWNDPSQACKQMTEDTKMEVETLGFQQIIQGNH